MNKERLSAIADAIESHPKVKLDMRGYVNDCGTSACVAGFASILFGQLAIRNYADEYKKQQEDPEYRSPLVELNFFDEGQETLDLDWNDAYELFMADSLYERRWVSDGIQSRAGTLVVMEDYDNGQVVKALRWMVANDKINWKEALNS